MAGLERNSSNGTNAMYYADSTMEFVFHDATRMPTDPADPKQLKKKRHIGNDDVHIIWNEHYRAYRTNTISGDFGSAKIIITPLQNGLFLINIHAAPRLRSFGPLVDSMVLPATTLGPLVRATAIDAYRACKEGPETTYDFKVSGHPYAQRAQDLNIIFSRHKVEKWTYEKFLQMIYNVEEKIEAT